jgi:hypothetical protein
MTFESAELHAGKHWTNSGENRDRRHLNQRVRGESRTVPIPPPLTKLLNAHINAFGIGTGGRLFISERNKDELPVGTIHRIWRWTRGYVCAEEVAAWAGQSIEILLRIYAKRLEGEQATMRRRVGDALGLTSGTSAARGERTRVQAVNLAAYLPRTSVGGR